jgi:hypothetical protein
VKQNAAVNKKRYYRVAYDRKENVQEEGRKGEMYRLIASWRL